MITKHYVPEGIIHITEHENGKREGHAEDYITFKKERFEDAVPAAPFVIAEHEWILNIYNKYPKTHESRLDVDFIYKVTIQVKDAEKFGAFQTRIDVYHDGGTVESKGVIEHLGNLFGVAIREKVLLIDPDSILKMFGHETNVFNDKAFQIVKDCEEECGIEILDMSFMITHVEDRNKEWEDFY